VPSWSTLTPPGMAAASVEDAAVVGGEGAGERCCIRGGGPASSFADAIHQKQPRPEEVVLVGCRIRRCNAKQKVSRNSRCNGGLI